ncbi:MAG: hypothetical protein SF187_03120 [Deltaproteobacteria bacterium]|nr:hypothetical protein [Deltaproteobacteria bacterium]
MKHLVLSLLMAGSVVACGSDDKKTNDLTPFLGMWNVGQAKVKVACAGFGDLEGGLTGVVNVVAGTGADLAMTFTDPALTGCTLRFNVKDASTATPLSGQSCAVSLQGITATLNVASGTFSAAGNNANMNLDGTANGSLGNIAFTCMGNVAGSLSRGATTDAGTDTAL